MNIDTLGAEVWARVSGVEPISHMRDPHKLVTPIAVEIRYEREASCQWVETAIHLVSTIPGEFQETGTVYHDRWSHPSRQEAPEWARQFADLHRPVCLHPTRTETVIPCEEGSR